MAFHKSPNENKSLQVYRTIFIIQANLKNAIVWMVSDRPSNSSRSFVSLNFFFDYLSVVSRDCNVYNPVVFLIFLYQFLLGAFQAHSLQLVSPSPAYTTIFLAPRKSPSICLSIHFLLFSFIFPLERQNALHASSFLISTRSGLQAEIRYLRISKNFFLHLVVWSKFNLFPNSQWITFRTTSCLVLSSFCASLLHSLTL